ncbi:MAG TPA: hypothetical protein VK530_00715 [Candidatus Acidoferrum sp.]|nr:hypothetical protein [Candidatus Acidoferrum sp.]
MEKTFTTLNQLEAAGLVTRYAIGGAFALSFYTEPIVTFDVDVFVFVPNADSPLVSLAPIYDYLRDRGCPEQREHVVIAGTPVQFIAAFNPLVEEGVREALDKMFKAVRVRVLRLEHLAAIMLKTGRAKDNARLAQVIEVTKLDELFFRGILERHALTAAWTKFQERFL